MSPYPAKSLWKYPAEHPKAGQRQEISVTLEMMRQLQQEYGVDGWYLDNGNAGEVLDDYDYMRQIRTDVGEDCDSA